MNIQAHSNDISLADTRSSLADVFSRQRKAGWAPCSDFDSKARIAALDRLRVLQRREADIIAALYADFRKPESEVRLTEILPVLQDSRRWGSHLRSLLKYSA